MQNRTNRNLLFGARASAGSELPASAAEADALELDNQRAVDALRGSAGSIKDIAIHIDTDVSDQNRMLDRMVRSQPTASSALQAQLAESSARRRNRADVDQPP